MHAGKHAWRRRGAEGYAEQPQWQSTVSESLGDTEEMKGVPGRKVVIGGKDWGCLCGRVDQTRKNQEMPPLVG